MGFLYNTYWNSIYVLNDLYYLMFANKDIIKDYKEKHHGEDCFIIGNGPSLTPEDLDKIQQSGVVTFASNRIYKMFDKTTWRPTYITVADESMITSKDVLYGVEIAKPMMFFTRSQFSLFVKDVKAPKCLLRTKYSRKYLDNPIFSVYCEKEIYDIATVTFFSLQLAAYMGFKRIYLIGMDNRYAYSKLRDGTIVRNEGVLDHHNDDNILPNPKTAVPTWELDTAFACAERYSKANNFRIYNATRGGYLESFERVPFEKVILNMEVEKI